MIAQIRRGIFETSSSSASAAAARYPPLLHREDWKHFYVGGDGQHSMYIDLVKQEYGVSSTDDRRFPLTRDLREMFRHVRELSAKDMQEWIPADIQKYPPHLACGG